MKTARRRKIEKGGYEILANKGDRLYIAEGRWGDMLMIKFGDGVVKGWFENSLTNEQIEKIITNPNKFIEEFDELTTKIKPQWHAFEANWLKWDRPNWPSEVL